MISNISLQVTASCIDPRFAPLASILHQVQIRARDVFYDYNMETAFDLKVSVRLTDDDILDSPSRCWLSTRVLEVRAWPVI